MKLLILAAGYATRLYPLTLNQPKPLLKVAGKPMLEHVLDRVLPAGGIDGIIVVTNNKFAGHFEEWSQIYTAPEGVSVTVIGGVKRSFETKAFFLCDQRAFSLFIGMAYLVPAFS